MSYYSIGNFGSENSAQANPVTYCFVSGLDSGAYHNLGGQNIAGPDNGQCQVFSAAYCANNWDGVCEYASRDTAFGAPIVNTVAQPNGIYNPTNRGEILVRNTAAEKYLKAMSPNCSRQYEPFDPTTAGSPLISRWMPIEQGCGNFSNYNSNTCIPVYGVDPAKIDNDPVMNKILSKPSIAMDILVNIYNNADLDALKGTKLYNYFSTVEFQEIVKSKVINV